MTSSPIERIRESSNGFMRALGYQTPAHIKVLVVDDNEDDFLLLKKKLQPLNKGVTYSLDRVSGPEKLLELLPQREYDIYMVDYRLSKANGLELIDKAGKMGFRGPFVLWTGCLSVGSKDFQRILSSVVVGFLDKSASADTTNEVLREALRNYRDSRLEATVVSCPDDQYGRGNTQVFLKSAVMA